MKKSKNSRNRSTAWQYKVMNGVKVKPALFDGRNVGLGKTMVAQEESGEVVYQDGRPVPYKDV